MPSNHRIAELCARLAVIGGQVAEAVAADDPEAAAFLAIMERLPPEAVVVVDMCIPGYWVAGYRRVPAPRKLAYPLGWGTLGFAFPASLGAALAGRRPDRVRDAATAAFCLPAASWRR